MFRRLAVFVGWWCCFSLFAGAQEIVNFTVPTAMCAGGSDTVTFGYRDDHSIIIHQGEATLGQSDRIFLPDGVPCGTMGCSYRSAVTFTDFAQDAVVSMVDDIKYVRLKMEHSYIGDIHINLTCPTGQKVSLLNWSGSGSSTCNSTIPSNFRDWDESGVNVGTSTFLGDAYDEYPASSNKCDSTILSNQPGTGWNYCWSSSTEYSYGAGDGRIYRQGNRVSLGGGDYAVDSSNVAAGTHFYHPEQSFLTLAGCPMNGTWYIEVIDGWSGDNGYIFEWDLSLNPRLLPHTCEVTGYEITGYGVEMVDDSTFVIEAPTDIDHDTTVAYTYTIHSTCGDIDSTVNLTFHPTYYTEDTIRGCEGIEWKGHTYTSNTNILDRAHTAYGCDSLSRLRLIVYPGYHLTESVEIVENDLPYTYLGRTFNEAVSDSLLSDTTLHGCDSNVTFTLTVHPNTSTDVYDTMCANELPYRWNGLSIESAGDTTVRLLTTYGADSVVTLHLTVFPISEEIVSLEVVENDLPVTILEQSYYGPVDTAIHFTNSTGCDSTVRYILTVHPNRQFTYRKTICDNELPHTWHGATFASADSVVLDLLDQYGADSTVTLILGVNPTYSVGLDTTMCENILPLLVGATPLDSSGTYTIALRTTEGCDSVVNVNLTVLPQSETEFFDTACANTSYTFNGESYSASGDYEHRYTNTFGCDSIITLHLNIMGTDLMAMARAVPFIVTPLDPEFTLYDISDHAASRMWTIDGNTYTQSPLPFTFPEGIDSLPVELTAYSHDGCADTTVITVLIDRSVIYIPNAFTPTLETNNTWLPVTTQMAEMEIWIYTREGLLVAHLEGTDTPWDGTSNGTACPQGAYVYTLQYRTLLKPEMQKTLTGTITLIR